MAGLLALTMAAGCGGGRDAGSQKACDDVRAVLAKYDEMKDSVEEIRALLLDAIHPRLRELAKPATGEVKTSIENLADTIDQANLDSGEGITRLRPKFEAFEPKFATAREDFTTACA